MSSREAVLEVNDQEEIKVIVDETPLISEPTSDEKWTAKLKRYCITFSVFVLALLTALPNFINGTMAEENAPAKDFINPEWWASLPLGSLILTILNGSSALIINFILNLFFLPLAAKKFYYNIKHFHEHPIRNTISIFLGIMGAIGAGAVAFAAFNFFPGTAFGLIFAATAALINFVIYVATRYIGVASALERFFNLFDKDLKTQSKFVELLDHVNPTNKNDIAAEYERIAQPVLEKYKDSDKISPDDLAEITQQLADSLNTYIETNPDLFLDKRKLEKFLHGLGIFFDLSLAFVFVFVPVTLTFMQAGFNGVSKFSEIVAGNDLSDLNPWYKRAIGILPGIASGALYSMSCLEMRTTLCNAFDDFCKKPTFAAGSKLLTLVLATYFSTSSMQNVATNVVQNPDNIAFVSDDVYGKGLIALNQVGGFGVNINACGKQMYSPKEVDSAANLRSFDGYVTLLRKGNEHRLDKKSTEQLRRCSFFNKPPKPIPVPQQEPRTSPNFVPAMA